MDINWYGQSCFRIKGKSSSLIIDPFDPAMLGLKLPKDFSAPLVLVSHGHPDHNFKSAVADAQLVIEGPGEYEYSGVTVNGTLTFHDPNGGAERGTNTVYSVLVDGVNIVHLGDLGHKLTEEQVGQIGSVDILMVPVGGNYTIDAKTAAEVVSQLEPRIVIPMHYKIDDLKVEIDTLDGFLKEMGAETIQPVNKLTITKDKLPSETQVVVLSKS